MGQREVLEFLVNKRAVTNSYFSVRDIQKGLQEMGYSNGVIKKVHKNIMKLVMFNQIEWQGKGYWQHHKEFRAKKDGK